MNNFTITMTDSWGDTWNGNVLTIRTLVGNSVVYTGTGPVNGQNSITESFALSSGPMTWTLGGGSYINETGFTISDENGAVIATSSGGTPAAGSFDSGVEVFVAKFDGTDNITLQGNAQTQMGPGKNVLVLDGDGDSADCGNSTALVPSNAITVSTWVMFSSLDNDWDHIVMRDDGVDRSYEISRYPANSPSNPNNILWRIWTSNDGSVAALYTDPVVAGRWYHVVGTYDGANSKLYVDGILKNTVAATGTVLVGNNSLFLGGAGSGYLNGLMNDTRIYKAALPLAEIESIYNDTNKFITLLGDASINLPLGTAYNDAGSTAEEADGTDLSGSMQTSITRSGTAPLYSENLGVNPPTGWTDGAEDRNEYFAFTGTRADTSEAISGYMHGRFGGGDDAEKTINIPGSNGKSIMVKGRYFGLQSWDYMDPAQVLIDGVTKIDVTMRHSQANPVETIVSGGEYITASYYINDFTGLEAGGPTHNPYSNWGPEGAFEFAIPHVMSGDSLTLKFANQATDGITDESMAFIIDEIIEVESVVGSVDVNYMALYTIKYSLSDIFVERQVTVQDVTAPVINLLGANPMNIAPGDSFLDPGCTASDDNDGNITGNVVVSGTVPIQDPDLKAYYSFDDANDYFGGHNGTLNGAIISAGGKYGNALHFPADADNNGIVDGDHVMELASPIHFDPNSVYTVAAWVFDLGYPYNLGPNGELGDNGGPYDQYANPTSIYTRNASLIASDTSEGVIPLRVKDGRIGFEASGFFKAHKPGTTDEVIFSERSDLFGWHHYVVVVDATLGSENVKYYVDGIFVAEISTGSYAAYLPNRMTRAVDFNRVGSQTSGWQPHSFVGQKMDDLAVWDKALFAQDILDLYNSNEKSGVGFGAAEGSYNITYTVSDASGNETSVVRVVDVANVVPPVITAPVGEPAIPSGSWKRLFT